MASTAYLSGLFDGEGCITIRRAKDRSARRGLTYSLLVDASQKKPEVLREFEKRWGGSILKGQRCMRWQVYSERAATALIEMLPHLIVKKAEARVAIDFQMRKREGPAKSISDELFGSYEKAYLELRRLKA